VAALSALSIGGKSVEETRQALVQKIGENITVRRFERLQTAARIAHYVHGVKIGVMVEFEGRTRWQGRRDARRLRQARFLSKDQVSPDAIAGERTIIEARAKESGKPPEIVAKMVDGGINKFLAEITSWASRS